LKELEGFGEIPTTAGGSIYCSGDQYTAWGVNIGLGGSIKNSGVSTSFSLPRTHSKESADRVQICQRSPAGSARRRDTTNPNALIMNPRNQRGFTKSWQCHSDIPKDQHFSMAMLTREC